MSESEQAVPLTFEEFAKTLPADVYIRHVEQAWNAGRASRDAEMEALLRELLDGLLSSGACEHSAGKCATHGFYTLPCPVADAVTKARSALQGAGE